MSTTAREPLTVLKIYEHTPSSQPLAILLLELLWRRLRRDEREPLGRKGKGMGVRRDRSGPRNGGRRNMMGCVGEGDGGRVVETRVLGGVGAKSRLRAGAGRDVPPALFLISGEEGGGGGTNIGRSRGSR
jgi:hypothetical protein